MFLREDVELAAIVIRSHYGLRHQLVKLVEELGELSAAIAKHFIHPTTITKAHIAEEAADVILVMSQVLGLMAITENDINKTALMKAHRQIKRIEEEKELEHDHV